jgi:hypothetical protein
MTCQYLPILFLARAIAPENPRAVLRDIYFNLSPIPPIPTIYSALALTGPRECPRTPPTDNATPDRGTRHGTRGGERDDLSEGVSAASTADVVCDAASFVYRGAERAWLWDEG